MTTDYHTPHPVGAPLTAAQINLPLGELDEEIGDLREGLGPIHINGGFTKIYDTDLWIAGAVRTNPTLNHQSIYAQQRLVGNMGALVHDAAAFEIRLNGISNATFLNAVEATVVVTGGANTIPNTRAITANIGFSGSPTGTITTAIVIAAQAIANPTAVTITTAYGLYVEQQTEGVDNWSVYAPGGVSIFGQINIAQSAGAAADLRWYAGDGRTGANLRWIVRRNSTAEGGANSGSDLEIQARADDGNNNGTALTITRSTLGIKFGTGPIGFYNTTPASKQTVTGSRGGNAALASLLTALATVGLITNSSSA